MTTSRPIHGGPRGYILDPTWPPMLGMQLPPEYVVAGPVELWELANNDSVQIRPERWGFHVDAVRLLASVSLHIFRYGGQWPYSGNLKPRTARTYGLAARDLLTVSVRQSFAGQLAVLPLRLRDPHVATAAP